MKKLLFVDCCIRAEMSRTLKLAEAFLRALPEGEYEVERVAPHELSVLPLDRARYLRREELVAAGNYSDPVFSLAKQFAACDAAVVAAPFWDMGIPAYLKTYFENVSVSGVTFACGEEGFSGLCRAEKMLFITTRGMEIPDGSEAEQASPYLKALCAFFGIGEFLTVSAWGTDVNGEEEVGRRLGEAQRALEEIAMGF